ncbi:hypothetical protein JB92DRAFT_3104229 [Gautieria morchelliformis]|nr:hypothetical protein JB92DRAFT_3104229 [Gautieria morchelliformis]
MSTQAPLGDNSFQRIPPTSPSRSQLFPNNENAVCTPLMDCLAAIQSGKYAKPTTVRIFARCSPLRKTRHAVLHVPSKSKQCGHLQGTIGNVLDPDANPTEDEEFWCEKFFLYDGEFDVPLLISNLVIHNTLHLMFSGDHSEPLKDEEYLPASTPMLIAGHPDDIDRVYQYSFGYG